MVVASKDRVLGAIMAFYKQGLEDATDRWMQQTGKRLFQIAQDACHRDWVDKLVPVSNMRRQGMVTAMQRWKLPPLDTWLEQHLVPPHYM